MTPDHRPNQCRGGVHPLSEEDTETKLKSLAREMRDYIWRGSGIKKALNLMGIEVLPSNFYSPVPSVSEIEASFEYRPGPPPYGDCPFLDAPHMREYLRTLLPYAGEFNPPDDGDQEAPGSFYWNNPAFSFSDAMSYYCIVRDRKPRRIVEVGSGFSTFVASAAVSANGHGEIVCIEPYPRDFLRGIQHVAEVIEKKVQEVELPFFRESLTDGDVLFIDSTHTVKAGSDCVYLYLKVLPFLDADLMIHAHDIFLPQAYPRRWLLEKHIYWNEQYLLQALLTDNPKFRAAFGSSYHRTYNAELLDRLMGGKAKSGGGSFWFQRVKGG